MKPEEKLFDAITDIDEELVDSAQSYIFHKQTKTWQRVASLVACLLVMVSIGYGILQMGSLGGAGSNTAADAENATAGETAPGDGADGGSQESVEETMVFTATVLEAGEGYLLVEPVEGDPMLATADQIQVSTEGVGLPDGVTVGSTVTITFSGGVMESYPAQISDVTEIVLAGD